MNTTRQAFMIITMRAHELRRLAYTGQVDVAKVEELENEMLQLLKEEFSPEIAAEAIDAFEEILAIHNIIVFLTNILGIFGF